MASIDVKVFVPKDLGLKNVERAVKNALTNTAKNVKVDFGVVTQTWQHKPDFPITDISDSSQLGVQVSTDDEIFGYVEDGTKPHIITPKRARVLVFTTGGRPKTRPNVIASSAGSEGSTIVRTKLVQHPGTQARNFSATIAKKWQAQIGTIVQLAIDSEVGH